MRIVVDDFHNRLNNRFYRLVVAALQTAHPCGPADTEECTHFASRG